MRATGHSRMVLAFVCLTIALVTIVLLGRPAGAGAEGSGELTVQPALGAPAVTMLGASPQEAPGEAWATSTNSRTLARYTAASGWETVPEPTAVGGGAIADFRFASGAGAGRTTPGGGVAAAAVVGIESQFLVVRDPGGSLRQAADPAGLLEPSETLFGEEGAAAMLAAEEGSGGQTRAYVVPSARRSVLAFDGAAWAREEVCVETTPAPGCTVPQSGFRVVAIDAAGGEAWLLARNALPAEGLELFRRELNGPGGTPVWRQQSLGPPGSTGDLYAQAAPLDASVTARSAGQPLTVSAAGVWADAVLDQGGTAIEATIYYDRGAAEVTGSWCDYPHPSPLCEFPLGAELPSGQGRSFAWPSGGQFGQRTITGVGQGAVVNLEGSSFNRLALAGGAAGASLGAALSAPDQGWLGAKPPLQLTRNAQPGGLQSWPVPFRRPLTAIAAQPGAAVGALGSEALAVGDNGQAARYLPGQGWIAEPLLSSAGKRATPTLRGVAWPESGRAYAVGDNAAMWLWRRDTGLWQPDPAAPPNLARANFTAIAFDPARPSRGYAVGKQGLLLAYGRQWTREALPPGVPAEANFSSIAFAGSEALATWKLPFVGGGSNAFYEGGVIANDGSGWRVDEAAEAGLGGAVPQRVAGLLDGGAAIASLGSNEAGSGTGVVIERPGPGAAWQAAAGGSPGYPVALAAIREADQVRAVVSVAPVGVEAPAGKELGTDQDQVFSQPPAGQAPLLTDPYPLPGTGLVARQTAGGWRDEQHQAYPLPTRVAGQDAYDLAQRPDPVLALLVSPEGSQGWAVGGETGTLVQFRGESLQTAGVLRYGATAAPPANASTAPLSAEAGMASFAIGGGGQCAGTCADMAGVGIGPDRWLKATVGKAAGIPNVRAFLYSGPGLADPGSARLSETLSPLAFGREENAYAHRLAAAAGALPVFAAPAESDIDSAGSLATFGSAFSAFGAPLGSSPPAPGIGPVSQTGPGQHYYSFDSGGTGGGVRVIVLDYSLPSLGDTQSCWLAGELAGAAAAGYPAIVVGERDLGRRAPNAAADAGEVVPILLAVSAPAGCAPAPAAASAYFFDFPEQNRTYNLSAGGRSIPTFGNGTLGYVESPRLTEKDFVGASGFLLGSVDVARRDPATNIAPVGVRLIPNVGSLALDPTDGTLLRRSRQALFRGLARRPLAGTSCTGGSAPTSCEVARPEPYVPIPTECQGSRCATGVFPEYTFTSSEPDIADFVAPDPRSLNPRNVLLVNGKPVLDSHSGLLCPFNEGTTTVTVSTGGLTYSQKVKVLGGTAQRPCGTTPLRNRGTPIAAVATPPPPAGEPPPTFSNPPTFPPPPAPAAPPTPAPAPHAPAPPPAVPTTFLAVPAQLATPLVPIVPPPPPLLLQPTPPSGSSYVQEREEEEEEAVEHSSAAVAERLAEGPASNVATLASSTNRGGGLDSTLVYTLPVFVLLGALAAANLRRPRPRRRERPQIAYEAPISPRRRR